jgi:hypothetical protein
VIGINNTSLEYTDQDLTSVVTLNSIVDKYLPSSLSSSDVSVLGGDVLSDYTKIYLPNNVPQIKSPMFYNKYKTDNNEILNEQGLIGSYSTNDKINKPWNPPGLFDNNSINRSGYDWLLHKYDISNSL